MTHTNHVTVKPFSASCPFGVTPHQWAIFQRAVCDGESLKVIAREHHCSPSEVTTALLSVNRVMNIIEPVRGTGLEVLPYRLIPGLVRAGFTNAEQVRHAGDAALMKADRVGPGALAQIRAVIPARAIGLSR